MERTAAHGSLHGSVKEFTADSLAIGGRSDVEGSFEEAERDTLCPRGTSPWVSSLAPEGARGKGQVLGWGWGLWPITPSMLASPTRSPSVLC